MQRAKQKEEKEEKEAVQQRAIDDEHWVLDIPELAKKEYDYLWSCQCFLFLDLCGFCMDFECSVSYISNKIKSNR